MNESTKTLERRVGRLLEVLATRQIKLDGYPTSKFEVEELMDGCAEYEEYILQLLATNRPAWKQGHIPNTSYFKIIQIPSEDYPGKKLVGVVQQSIVDSITGGKKFKTGTKVEFTQMVPERAIQAEIPLGTKGIVVTHGEYKDSDNKIVCWKYDVPFGKTAVKIKATDLGYVESIEADRQFVVNYVWSSFLKKV